MTQALEAKERAMTILHYFQAEDDIELRRRGYRRLPNKYEGCFKRVYLGHDHVIKIQNERANKEYKAYQSFPSDVRKHLVPTVRLDDYTTLQPKGKLMTIWQGGRSEWRPSSPANKFASKTIAVRQAINYIVQDTHNANFARFGDTVLCIDFDY